jgi:hypothetical protein
MAQSLYNFSIVENMEFFLAGVAGETRKLQEDDLRTISNNLTAYNTILSLQTKIRQVYDEYVPNIHVLDINTVTSLIVSNIKEKVGYFIVFKKNAGTEDISEDVKNTALNKLVEKLNNKDSAEYNRLKNSIRSAVLKHWRSVKVTGSNPIQKLNDLSKDLFDFQNSTSVTKEQALKTGQKFAIEIGKVFGRSAVLGVYDRDLGSSADVYIYFGKSYQSMRSSINEAISTVVKTEFLNILSRDLIQNINVGYVVNFGHAMIISKDGENELGRFVNSPGYASSVYGVAKSGATTQQIEQASVYYRDKSGLVSNKITFSKSFQTKSSILMRLGVTFTLPEDWNINQTRGREEEKVAKLDLVPRSAAKKFTRSEQVEYIKYIIGILREKVLTKNPENASSSKTLKQYLKSAVIQLLKGEEPKEEKSNIVKAKTTRVKQRTIVLNPAAKKQLKLSKPKVTAPKAATTVSRTTVAPVPKTVINLSSLLNQINGLLQQQIKRNMGTGNRKDILNYRSGRFANSVKVERLSESREGMITAFYSYMKNPYATFSKGGRQERPASRDPKLLIAKSIREIAQTQVANRMRAVNV